MELYLDANDANPAETWLKTFVEWKEVEIQRPMHVVRFTGLRSESPGAVAARYVGFTNSTVIFDDQPGMWLCTELSGSSNDGGETWLTTIELQRAPEVYPVTPGSGIPIFPEGQVEQQLGWGVVYHLEEPFQRDDVVNPMDLTIGVGVKAAQLYKQVDFRVLTGLSVHFGPLP